MSGVFVFTHFTESRGVVVVNQTVFSDYVSGSFHYVTHSRCLISVHLQVTDNLAVKRELTWTLA